MSTFGHSLAGLKMDLEEPEPCDNELMKMIKALQKRVQNATRSIFDISSSVLKVEIKRLSTFKEHIPYRPLRVPVRTQQQRTQTCDLYSITRIISTSQPEEGLQRLLQSCSSPWLINHPGRGHFSGIQILCSSRRRSLTI